jgi:GLPGLI family protein
MKHTFKIFSLFVLGLSFFSFAQNDGNAYYSKKSSYDIDGKKELDKIDTELKNSFKSVNNSMSDLSFILSFNDSLAIFQEDKKLLVGDKNDFSNKLTKMMSGYSGATHYNLRNKLIISERKIRNKRFLIEKKFSVYNWTLTKETIKINDLNCFKATTVISEEGRNGINNILITVWYTPDISLPIGPDGFAGLPGLIVQIEKGQVITILDKIEFTNKNRAVKIEIPTDGLKMSQDEFNALMKDMALNKMKYYNKN